MRRRSQRDFARETLGSEEVRGLAVSWPLLVYRRTHREPAEIERVPYKDLNLLLVLLCEVVVYIALSLDPGFRSYVARSSSRLPS